MQSEISTTQNVSPINKYFNNIATKTNLKIKLQDQELEQQFYFDYFSRRVAFTTSDGRIKIYSIIDKGKNLFEKSFEIEFQAHYGRINSISWQCPKFGNKIITCGRDDRILIWEEEGKVWRSQQLEKTHKQPLLVKWIEDTHMLGIAFQDGQFQLREGDSYDIQLEQQLYNKQLFSFDLKLIDDKLILVSCGSDGDYVSFDIFVMRKQDKKFIKRCSQQIQDNSALKQILIAPYIIDYELKIGYQLENCVGIVTFEFQELEQESIQFIQQNSQPLEVSECKAFQWSMLGNEILVYGAESTRLFQQNINNQYQPI